jgi:hypothetical protein
MPNELQLANANEAPRQDLPQLQANIEGALEKMAKDFNADPSKYMADMKKGSGSIMTDMPGMGESKENIGSKMDKSASGSQFLLMGGTGRRTKATARFEALDSGTNAMGIPLSYKEKKENMKLKSKIMAGKGKAEKDPLGGGGDRELGERYRLARMSVGKGAISPQGIKSNPEMAKVLGGGDLIDQLGMTRKEIADPSLNRIVAGAIAGDDLMQTAFKGLNEGVKQEAVMKLDMPEPRKDGLMGYA